MAQNRRQVPGPYDPGDALLHVEVHIPAGGEQIGLHADEQPVGPGDHHIGRMALHRVGPDRRTHLAHDGGGSRAVPLHVPDDEGHVTVTERNDVVPVAADLEAYRRGKVAGDGDPARQLRELTGQQAALEHGGELVARVQRVGAHQRLSHQTCGRGQQ